jgi:hypothetical protein
MKDLHGNAVELDCLVEQPRPTHIIRNSLLKIQSKNEARLAGVTSHARLNGLMWYNESVGLGKVND